MISVNYIKDFNLTNDVDLCVFCSYRHKSCDTGILIGTDNGNVCACDGYEPSMAIVRNKGNEQNG